MVERAGPEKTVARAAELLARRMSSYQARMGKVDDPAYMSLRKLLTRKYVNDGTIDQSHLEDDLIPDRFKDRSVPCFVEDSSHKLLVGARIINVDQTVGLGSLQGNIYGNGIDAQKRHFLEERNKEKPGSVAEFASLVRDDDISVLALYPLFRELASYSVEQGIDYWFIGLKPAIVRQFERTVRFAMEPAGSEVWYEGLEKPSIPFIVDVRLLYETLFRQREIGGAATRAVGLAVDKASRDNAA